MPLRQLVVLDEAYVDDAGVAQSCVEQEALAPDARLVEQATGGGVAEHHEIDLVGSQPGI